MDPSAWTIAQAKEHLQELGSRAVAGEPQFIAVDGGEVALISAAAYHALLSRNGGPVDSPD